MGEELLEDPVFGYRYRLARTGDVLRVEMWVDPGGGTARHFHPRLEERYQVFDGELEFDVGGERRPLSSGERLTVTAGVRHSFRNPSDSSTTHAVAEVEPAMTLDECLVDAAALAQAGRYAPSGRPRGLRGLLDGAVFSERYRDVTVMAFPPPALQRLFAPSIARFELWRRRRAAT